MSEPDSVLLVDSSAVARGRLRDDLQARYAVTIAQTLEIARARVESLTLRAAIVRITDGSDDELHFLRWLSRRSIPVFAVLRAATLERKLTGLGTHRTGLAPNPRDEVELTQHSQRIRDWLSELPHRQTSVPAPRRDAEFAVTGLSAREPAAEGYASDTVICVGISTGGPEALETLLPQLPATTPPLMIVQHMPVGFTAALAKRLDDASTIVVAEAQGGETLQPGHAWIAPGDRQMRLRRAGLRVATDVFDGPAVDRHRPSVNVLFESAARLLGPSGVGVIMTGMGDDGARGLLAMRQAGAITIAQDASSCAVFGMPQRAAALGAVAHHAALNDLAALIIDLIAQRARGTRRTSSPAVS